MSSLHQDHLLVEGSEPVPGPRTTVAKARGTSRRPSEEKATSTVPMQRQGKSQRSGSTSTDADGAGTTPRPERSTTSKAMAAAAGTAGAWGKAAKKATTAAAATLKAATAKAATATAATAKAATAGKPAATESAALAPPTPVADPAEVTPPVVIPHARGGAHRATPYKRASVQQPSVVEPASEETALVEATDSVASLAEGTGSPLLRRVPPAVRRRPALYLAAALVGALGVSLVSTTGPTAQATDTMSHSVSVAHELGIDAAPTEAVIDPATTERLEELAVSRNARDAEQTAAAAVQTQADQAAAAAAAAAAAEAARPKAVLPVDGARITSGFGARWGTLHAGIDFAAPMLTPEKAVMDGVVLEAGPASGFGLAVYIQHANGDVTVYGHMEQILVQAGQVVRAGDTIALLGQRGQSTGPHLHLEVHVGGINGQKIDPMPWLRERGLAV